jgi:hypothetical protein
MTYYRISTTVVIIFLLAIQNTMNSGCTKTQEVPLVDTVILPPPPPPPSDTITLVRKIELLSSLYPNYAILPYITYSFYYDNQKRLTSVGMKTYNLNVNDTFTTKFLYSGNSTKPTNIIMPDINFSSAPAVDTTWFFYGLDGKLQKDSTSERWLSATVRKPLYRLHTYLNSSTTKIDWFWTNNNSITQSLKRIDTVKFNNSESLAFIKTVYPYDTVSTIGSYAKVEFNFSQIVNPLSKLNISGTPYSLIYTDVKRELLGNSYHPLVYNSNGIAFYLDFISPYIPNMFYITGFNSLHQVIGQGGATFPIEITPWTIRSNYPSQIRVKISNSIAGDSYIYRYTY